MPQWYIYNNGKVEGPFETKEIIKMKEQGDIGSRISLWSKELSEWKSLSSIETFNADNSFDNDDNEKNDSTQSGNLPLTKMCPYCQKNIPYKAIKCRYCGSVLDTDLTSDISLENDSSNIAEFNTNIYHARPWIRYFARMTDIFLFTILFMFLFAIILALISPELLDLFSSEILIGLFCIFIYNFAEALMLSAWGTTPGKLLLSTSVKDIRGNNLSYSEALSRSFKVYIRGLGMGIPLISLFTLINSYYHLKKNPFGKTSWDFEGCYRVEHKPLTVWGVTGVILVWMFFIWLNML